MKKDKSMADISRDIAKKVTDELRKDDEEDTFAFGNSSEATTPKDVEHDLNSDIFDCGDGFAKKGDTITYHIYKNGEFLAKRYHPFSWEQLQKELGGGYYRLSARSATKNCFIKHETKAVADIQKPETEEVRRQLEPQSNTPGFMEMLTLMNTMSEKARTEAREAAKDAQNGSNLFVSSFVDMMKSNQNQSQTMFIELAKINQTIAEKITENTNKMFEKMNERFEKMIESGREDKKEKYDVMKLIEMRDTAQKQGYDQFNKIMQLAEAKAQEKIEMFEENLEGRSSSGEKSTTDRVMETLLPVIATALAQNKTQQQIIPQQRRLPQGAPFRPKPPIAQVRPNIIKPQTTGLGQRIAPNQVKARNETKNEIPSAEDKKNIGDSRGSNREHDGGFVIDRIEPIEVGEKLPSRKEIEDVLLPFYTECLMLGNIPPKEAATKTVDMVKQIHISRESFLKVWKKEYIIELVSALDLGNEAKLWLEETYANIQNQTGMDDRGEHAPNS